MTPAPEEPLDVRALVLLADVLIPRWENRPSASDVDLAGRWIHEALRLRPDLRPDLSAALDAVASNPGSAQDAVRAFARREPGKFDAVGNLVGGAYLMAPQARAAIGYPGQEARPLVEDVQDHLDLLSAVVERGPVYRPTDQAARLEES